MGSRQNLICSPSAPPYLQPQTVDLQHFNAEVTDGADKNQLFSLNIYIIIVLILSIVLHCTLVTYCTILLCSTALHPNSVLNNTAIQAILQCNIAYIAVEQRTILKCCSVLYYTKVEQRTVLNCCCAIHFTEVEDKSPNGNLSEKAIAGLGNEIGAF